MSDFEGQDGPKRFADGQNVTVAGVITASRTRTTKNNTLMAYVTIEDELAPWSCCASAGSLTSAAAICR